jgi:hypothetical protein
MGKSKIHWRHFGHFTHAHRIDCQKLASTQYWNVSVGHDGCRRLVPRVRLRYESGQRT